MAANDGETCPWCTHGQVTFVPDDEETDAAELDTVETRPDPTGGEITRCADCYAEYVAERTMLTPLEAHALTLVNDGHDEQRISRIVGRSFRNVRGTIDDALTTEEEARERRRRAERTIDALDRLSTEVES